VKLSAILVLSAGAMSLGACQSAHPKADGAPAEVGAVVAEVRAVDWPAAIEAGGSVRARFTAAISSRIVAPVVEVRVKPGDHVTRGATLIVLDARELTAQAARAAAAIAATGQGAKAAASDVTAAESGLTLARASRDRVQTLHAKQSATAQELDEATAAYAAADARVIGARARVAGAAAALDAAAAAGDAAIVAVSYSTLTAPFDGVVASRSVDPGSMAAPGVELLSVEDTSVYRLEARLDESRAGLASIGVAAEVRIDGAGDAWTPATVVELARIDPAAHSVLVKLDVPAGAGVRSGGFGRVRLTGPARRTVAVPASAVVRRGQLAFLFAIDTAGLARLRAITPGETRGADIEILAGATAGERVVAAPPPALEDGMRVRAEGEQK
jgi:RND family efflux transporter MFP subunit